MTIAAERPDRRCREGEVTEMGEAVIVVEDFEAGAGSETAAIAE